MRIVAEKREMAERHVRDGRRIVSRQKALVLTLTGEMRINAETLLVAFERSQTIFEEDLAAIIEHQISN